MNFSTSAAVADSKVDSGNVFTSESIADQTDEQLVAKYRTSGRRDIYEALMRRYEREIYAYLRRYIGNAEMAEDAFQGTFLQVHLKCNQFDLTRRFRPWLYAIATNQAIDVQRRNKRHRMVSLDRPANGQEDDRGGSWSEKLEGAITDPLAAASKEENGRWVHHAVESLGEPMQQVVELVYYQGLKYREAAEILGIPVGTVKSRLHAAVNRLSGLWDDSHDGERDAEDQPGV
ncbi:RNA polymerase sigma factor [Rhodopirellula europaea]|uniref:RNA polymerase, sigma-24 subunit, ECF subfamily n=1 Tax=Rhodopirellula europaea 6C TaxID=1263867 RepID=M2AY85_9BACT|nr:RNA polymerase sigma factor [Rhodopirellula europaea]EMB17672.1 RNA polymerase, sigma-24 subunit, ECF subfamily [Rhodopirellula europaea 6C]